MNPQLIHDFREKICEENNRVCLLYKNVDGKNHWNIICSAMDWIETVVNQIDTNNLSRENNNDASISMIVFVMCVDALWEAIKRLYMVVYKTNQVPFKNDHSVFSEKKPDNEYFKDIRACFAAHQLDAREIFGDEGKGDRWYASWSGGTFSDEDFSVFLYSNNPSIETRLFSVKFNEILAFAAKRYNLLNDMMTIIDEELSEHNRKMKDVIIKHSPDVLEQIDILLEENKKRLESDYYESELSRMKGVFEIKSFNNEKNDKALETYRLALKKELDEIMYNLQNMEQKELENEINISRPSSCNYSFSKVSDAFYQKGPLNAFIISCAKELENYITDYVDMSLDMNLDEIFVLICAGFYLRELEE